MASKRCPACGLVNPASAERRDCGRSFVDGTVGAKLSERLAKPEPGRARMPGAAWAIIAGGVALELAGFAVNAAVGPHFEPSGAQLELVSGTMAGAVLKVLGGAIAAAGLIYGRVERARRERERDDP